ncbi:MAG: hypothetical protein QG661_1123 [Actinomycetota bacterium]|jgi:hypothetical protein|nr:hypothetical protein [Actinomycetota bacterium]
MPTVGSKPLPVTRTVAPAGSSRRTGVTDRLRPDDVTTVRVDATVDACATDTDGSCATADDTGTTTAPAASSGTMTLMNGRTRGE